MPENLTGVYAPFACAIPPSQKSLRFRSIRDLKPSMMLNILAVVCAGFLKRRNPSWIFRISKLAPAFTRRSLVVCKAFIPISQAMNLRFKVWATLAVVPEPENKSVCVCP